MAQGNQLGGVEVLRHHSCTGQQYSDVDEAWDNNAVGFQNVTQMCYVIATPCHHHGMEMQLELESCFSSGITPDFALRMVVYMVQKLTLSVQTTKNTMLRPSDDNYCG